MSRPTSNDHAPYFGKYISLVDAGDIGEAIARYAQPLQSFYTGLPEAKADYRYADSKWSLKDLLQHVIDTERIMAYRVLRIARNDMTPNASFDENSFAANADADSRSFAALKEEFIAVRKSTDLLLQSLSDAQLSVKGISSDYPTTANAVAFIIYGHLLHHQQVVEERYL